MAARKHDPRADQRASAEAGAQADDKPAKGNAPK